MNPTGILQLFTVQSYLSYAALYRKLLKTFVAMVASCIEICRAMKERSQVDLPSSFGNVLILNRLLRYIIYLLESSNKPEA